MDSLKNEIINNYKGEVIETIYIGGGTPSCLKLEELKYLFEIINIFKELAEEYGKTIIVVTHSNQVAEMSDQRVLLKD